MPNKERYWKNPEYYREKTHEYNVNNASKMAETSRAWAEKNPDKVSAIQRRYYLKNKELLTRRTAQKREALKAQCVNHLGGICNKCGLDTNCLAIYCFHHRNSAEKNFSISKRRDSTFEAIKSELDKCELLCANCHRKEHYLDIAKPNKFIKHQRNKKAKAVAMFDGICIDCKLLDNPCVYDFHHPDSSKKDFSFRDHRSWELTTEELSKCVMLCVNCHKQRHANRPLRFFNELVQE